MIHILLMLMLVAVVYIFAMDTRKRARMNSRKADEIDKSISESIKNDRHIVNYTREELAKKEDAMFARNKATRKKIRDVKKSSDIFFDKLVENRQKFDIEFDNEWSNAERKLNEKRSILSTQISEHSDMFYSNMNDKFGVYSSINHVLDDMGYSYTSDKYFADNFIIGDDGTSMKQLKMEIAAYNDVLEDASGDIVNNSSLLDVISSEVEKANVEYESKIADLTDEIGNKRTNTSNIIVNRVNSLNESIQSEMDKIVSNTSIKQTDLERNIKDTFVIINNDLNKASQNAYSEMRDDVTNSIATTYAGIDEQKSKLDTNIGEYDASFNTYTLPQFTRNTTNVITTTDRDLNDMDSTIEGNDLDISAIEKKMEEEYVKLDEMVSLIANDSGTLGEYMNEIIKDSEILGYDFKNRNNVSLNYLYNMRDDVSGSLTMFDTYGNILKEDNIHLCDNDKYLQVGTTTFNYNNTDNSLDIVGSSVNFTGDLKVNDEDLILYDNISKNGILDKYEDLIGKLTTNQDDNIFRSIYATEVDWTSASRNKSPLDHAHDNYIQTNNSNYTELSSNINSFSIDPAKVTIPIQYVPDNTIPCNKLTSNLSIDDNLKSNIQTNLLGYNKKINSSNIFFGSKIADLSNIDFGSNNIPLSNVTFTGGTDSNVSVCNVSSNLPDVNINQISGSNFITKASISDDENCIINDNALLSNVISKASDINIKKAKSIKIGNKQLLKLKQEGDIAKACYFDGNNNNKEKCFSTNSTTFCSDSNYSNCWAVNETDTKVTFTPLNGQNSGSIILSKPTECSINFNNINDVEMSSNLCGDDFQNHDGIKSYSFTFNDNMFINCNGVNKTLANDWLASNKHVSGTGDWDSNIVTYGTGLCVPKCTVTNSSDITTTTEKCTNGSDIVKSYSLSGFTFDNCGDNTSNIAAAAIDWASNYKPITDETWNDARFDNNTLTKTINEKCPNTLPTPKRWGGKDYMIFYNDGPPSDLFYLDQLYNKIKDAWKIENRKATKITGGLYTDIEKAIRIMRICNTNSLKGLSTLKSDAINGNIQLYVDDNLFYLYNINSENNHYFYYNNIADNGFIGLNDNNKNKQWTFHVKDSSRCGNYSVDRLISALEIQIQSENDTVINCIGAD